MGYDVEKGFHMGTLLSCMLLAFVWSMFGNSIMPNTPFMIRFYIPDVVVYYHRNTID